MSWYLWVFAVFTLYCFFKFLMGKLKDPMNPAGYALPGVEKSLKEIMASK